MPVKDTHISTQYHAVSAGILTNVTAIHSPFQMRPEYCPQEQRDQIFPCNDDFSKRYGNLAVRMKSLSKFVFCIVAIIQYTKAVN